MYLQLYIFLINFRSGWDVGIRNHIKKCQELLQLSEYLQNIGWHTNLTNTMHNIYLLLLYV